MTPDPLQTYAYATAVQAFIYALAPDGMYRRLSEEVLDPKTRKAGFNAFAHTSELSSPTLALFPAPNVDTIYSTAWLDVRNEPAVLSAPGTDGRYWTAQVLDFDSNTLANLGARLDGTKAGTFAVVGPGWTGKLPEGITRSVQSPTGFVAVLLRVLVNGPDDLPTAVGFQKQFTQAALSRHTQGQTGPASNVIEGIPMHKADSPAERLAVLDRLLKLNPLRPGEEALMSQFATIGVGPGRVLLPIKPSKDTLKMLCRRQHDRRRGWSKKRCREERLAGSAQGNGDVRLRLPSAGRGVAGRGARPVASRSVLPQRSRGLRRSAARWQQGPLQRPLPGGPAATHQVLLVDLHVRLEGLQPRREPDQAVLDRRPNRRIAVRQGWIAHLVRPEGLNEEGQRIELVARSGPAVLHDDAALWRERRGSRRHMEDADGRFREVSSAEPRAAFPASPQRSVGRVG
jgi:hypothetical protein